MHVTIPSEQLLPSHLAALPGSAWGAWRWIGLRGAGFTADSVLRLAAPDCAAAADQLLALEEAERQARHALRQAFNAAIKE